MIDKSMDSRHLLIKIDIILLIKTLQRNLANISLLVLKIVKKLNQKVISLVKAINIVIDASIFKAKLFIKSIPKFNKDYKNY